MPRRDRARRIGVARAQLLAAIAVGAVSCVPRNAVQVVPCSPVTGPLPATAHSDSMAGTFGLTMVATSGASDGRTVTGTLDLLAYDGAARAARAATVAPGNFAFPFHGRARIAIDSIGAVAPGDIAASDPASPGVIVISSPRPDSGEDVMLRFGSEANGTAVRFDGARLVFFVDALTADHFAGRWSSSDGTADAAGFFCAVRRPDG